MNKCLIQNFNRVEDLYETIQSKEKLKAVENQKNFRIQKLGLDPDVVTFDEQHIINALQVAFEGEIILTQHCIINRKTDAYFSKFKLGVEVDEYNHEGRNFEYEQRRQLMVESHGITIIRINPDAADFDMNRSINQIYTHIIKSTKKSLIDDLSKRLVELQFKSNHSIKSNCSKWIVKNILPNYRQWKTHNQK